MGNLKDRKILGTTLWSNITDKDSKHLNDYVKVFWRRLFNDNVVFLEDNVRKHDIVLTHHSPSIKFEIFHFIV